MPLRQGVLPCPCSRVGRWDATLPSGNVVDQEIWRAGRSISWDRREQITSLERGPAELSPQAFSSFDATSASKKRMYAARTVFGFGVGEVLTPQFESWN